MLIFRLAGGGALAVPAENIRAIRLVADGERPLGIYVDAEGYSLSLSPESVVAWANELANIYNIVVSQAASARVHTAPGRYVVADGTWVVS